MKSFRLARSFLSYSRLIKYIRKHRRLYYEGIILSFVKKVFDIAPEILIGIVIDVVVNRERSFLARWGVDDPLSQLIWLSVLTLVIWVCESMAEYGLLLKWRGLAQGLQHDLRVDAYCHLQKLDMAYLEDQNTGRLIAVLNDDVNQLERFFNEGMNNLVQILTSTVLVGAVFFTLAPKIAVFTFIPMPIVFLSAFYFQRKAAPLYLNVREMAGRLSARLANNVGGLATIRSFTAENLEVERLANDSEKYVEANLRAIAVSARFNPLVRMGVLVGFLATFVAGGVAALRADLNVGSYGVLVFLSQRLLWPLRDLAGTVDLFERAMASADRVFNLLGEPIQLERARAGSASLRESSIEFKDVSFHYRNQVPVLKGVNASVPNGKTVAVVGPTGSGKSTITKLLLGFYRPQTGKITIGGQDIVDCDPRVLRSRIGLVSQDVYLFDGSIRDNIAYGKPGASESEIFEAARRAYVDEFIDRFPQGMATMIGERGQKLSGGQRQRISIARVILKNPPILIFDEATSSVDNETESIIQKSLAEISKGRTTIVIAHRLSTVVHADHIYVLVKGEIVEQGTHQELLAQQHVYAQLWSLQTRKEGHNYVGI